MPTNSNRHETAQPMADNYQVFTGAQIALQARDSNLYLTLVENVYIYTWITP